MELFILFYSIRVCRVENILYVLNPEFGGLDTALSRAVFSVPGHRLFWNSYGLLFCNRKFEPEYRTKYLLLAYFIPGCFMEFIIQY